jgi:hypothetical protein
MYETCVVNLFIFIDKLFFFLRIDKLFSKTEIHQFIFICNRYMITSINNLFKEKKTLLKILHLFVTYFLKMFFLSCENLYMLKSLK